MPNRAVEQTGCYAAALVKLVQVRPARRLAAHLIVRQVKDDCNRHRERRAAMKGKTLIRCFPILVALAIGACVAIWPPLKFANLGGADLASRFAILVLFSLLIERTVEILMSIWRSEEANIREAAVQRLLAANTPPTDPALINAQTNLIQYKAETLQWTMPVGFALGLLVSAFGVRALSQFIDPAAIGEGAPPEAQRWWFNIIDILFTGALLAGGADPIHKLLDLYRKFVESSAAKTAGTKP